MKKMIAIVLLFILISIISFYILFYKENHDSLNNMLYAEQTGQYNRIVISGGGKSHGEVYYALKSLLDEYRGNIFFTRLVKYNKKSGYVKYVYLSDLNYLSKFKLEKGRFFNINDITSNKFLSTRNTGDSRQIGQLSDFAGDDIFEIRTLMSMQDENAALEGSAILQLATPQNIDSFIEELNQAGIFCQKEGIYTESSSIYSYLFDIILIILFLLLALLIFYDILSSYKKIGINKMFGYSKFSIWLKCIIPVVIQQIIILTIIPAVLILIMIKDYNYFLGGFLIKLAVQNCILFIMTFFSISLPFLYINKITISNMLKNKRPIETITIMNVLVKLGLSVFLVVSFFYIYSQYSIVSLRYSSSFKIWETTKNYAIIPNIQDVSPDLFSSSKFKNDQKELYIYFNKKGSILADFHVYWPVTRERKVKEQPIDYKRDIINVNPNYLKINPVVDVDSKEINIDESDKNYILLIPVQYHKYEGEIRKHHQFIKNGYGKNSVILGQNIKIIWIKPNQDLFTYRIDTNPAGGNKIKNSIIRVITESNGDIIDYDRVIAYSGNPFKIKVDDPLDPAASIRPKLKEYGLSQYIDAIPSVYDVVASDVKEITDMLLFFTILLLLLAGMISVLIFQNIYNYFEQHRVRLAIQQFHGYNRIDRYRPYFSMVTVSWAVVITITGFLYIKSIFPVLVFCAACLLLELFISYFTLFFVEKRKLSTVTKGG